MFDDGRAGSADSAGDSTVMSWFPAAFKTSRFTMKRRLRLDIAEVVAQFQQKNCEVAGQIARPDFWKRGSPKIASHWG
jgi:hypothetical protein